MRHSAGVAFEAEYLLHVPTPVNERTLLVLTLHGYGSNPEAMLRMSEMALGGDAIIASLRAPNQYYLSSGALGTPVPGSPIGYNWGTTAHAALNIRLHHEMVGKILGELRARFQVRARHVVLMGFSQPVGLNYRYIGTNPEDKSPPPMRQTVPLPCTIPPATASRGREPSPATRRSRTGKQPAPR